MSQLGQNRAVHEFFRWESQSWVEVVADMNTDEKAYFMPVGKLKSYFAANNSENLSKIISEVFESSHPPIDPDLILSDHTAIFCILLRVGQGKCIEEFARYEELSDRRLPFDPNHPPEGFPELDDDPTFLQRFCEKQWIYCVPIFDGRMLHKHFGKQRLLPITHKEPCGAEGMADRDVIKVYGPHNKLLPAGQATQINNPNANTFLLKRYRAKEGEVHYKQEVDGFRSVKHADSIIRFYGSYKQGNEFNVLLEFADKGSLEEYFKRESPPSRGVDIIKFWEGLFQLIKGLKAIHSVREAHHDVKPETVLVLSNGAESLSDWQFKFSDFGLKDSKGKASQTRESTDNAMQHAPTYGAPECYAPYNIEEPYNIEDQAGRRSTKIVWAADIWSLGCIYSEAAMWIADGYKGLLDYRKQRMAETDRILFKGGDCFHDGERVLQSVLDAHRDIEDRLRRSDYITKHVLDAMVDEMLWEEDRPNAKALSRKAEMVSSKARQRLSVNTGDSFSRPGSAASRTLPPNPLPPPTQPLPPIPQGLRTGLSSIAERQSPPNVEKWRSQLTTGSRTSGSQYSRPETQYSRADSDLSGLHSQQIRSNESVSDLDRELTGSMASWQMGDDNSAASPITPFTSPHVSVNYDYYRHNPNEGKPRALRQQQSYEYRSPPKAPSHGAWNLSSEMSDTASVAPPLSDHPAFARESVVMPPIQPQRNEIPAVPEPRPAEETRAFGRTMSRAGSHSRGGSRTSSRHSSSTYSVHSEQVQAPPKKRLGGFSLFPSRTRTGSTPNNNTVTSLERTSTTSTEDTVPRSIPPFSSGSGAAPALGDPSQSIDYLSMNTCLEWKRAHKKVKKQKVPPLPGAELLEGLNDRDHAFIIDDSASMASVWPDVKRVFEALSYVVKGMSPDGTELFYTVSFDTYRRKDTFDLCQHLEAKATAGETNISYRLNLQLEQYRLKLYAPKKGKKATLRPYSIYILTNGEWGEGVDPKITIKQMADHLTANEMRNGQVTIELISFASNAAATQKVNDLAKADFGVDIVDCTPWRGNVLKMLLGPLDKARYTNGGGGGGGDSGAAGSGLSVPASRPPTSLSSPISSGSVVSELA